MSRDNVGLALPTPADADNWGMTLRDYFAAKAMTEILARWGSHQTEVHGSIAALAYQMADAMIAERAAS